MAEFEHSLGFNIAEANIVEPTEFKTTGFQAGYKLPAPHFNWFLDKTSKCIEELKNKKFDLGGVYTGDMNDLVSPGQYRVQSNANLPANEAYYGQVFVGRGVVTGGNNDTCTQLVLSYQNRRMYHRGGLLRDGAWIWEEWSTVYTTAHKPTFNAAAWLGLNPVTKPSDDTTVKWCSLGSGFAQYSGLDQLTDQPSRYGFLVTYTYGSDVAQFWFVLPSGALYKRSGNTTGWGQTWTKIYDTANKPTANELGVESLSGGTEIPNNADLNTYKTQGNYHCLGDATAQTLSNCPVTNAFRMKVGHPTGGGSYTYQEIVNWNTGTRYYRQCLTSSNSWTEWIVTYDSRKKPTPSEIGAVATENILAASTDLNNIITSGMYRIGNTPVNAPTEGCAYGQLLVVHGGQDTISQIVFPYKSSRMYMRTGNPTIIDGAGQWNGWVQMYSTGNKPTPADIGALPDSVVPVTKGGTGKTSLTDVTVGYSIHPVMINCSNMDINELKSAGFYFGYENMLHAAVENEISVFEVISYSTDWLLQRQTRLTDGKSFFRYFYSGSSWSDWYSEYSSKHKPTPAEIGALPDSTVPINKGGTGATDVAGAKTNLGFIGGTYTGTGNSGSGAMYKFDTGARGSNLLVIAGYNFFGFVTPTGACMFDVGNGGICSSTTFGGGSGRTAYYENGYIHLETDNKYINGNGYTYYYRCL